MIKHKELNFFSRFVAPLFAIISSMFMVFAAVISHMETVSGYLIIFAVIMLAGILLMGKNKKAK